MKKRIIAIMFSLILVFPVLGFAGELKLVKGKGFSVCEAHLKNLEALKLDEMVCQRDESYPQENGITRPKWEQLNFNENKELLKKISNFFNYGDQFAEDKGFGFEILSEKLWQEQEVLGQKFPPQYALYITKADIDNDGTAEKTLLFREYICMFTHVYSRPLFVLDEEKYLIDIKKTEPLLQNPFPRDIKAKAVNNGYQLYDIFFYKNASYFDKWNMRDLTLRVYNQSKGKTKEVCKYKYVEKFSKNSGGKNEN